jgi:hypothetical protein
MDPPIEKGISVNFGTTDFGSGTVQPKEKIRSEPLDTPAVEPAKQEEVVEEEVEEPVKEEVPEKVVAKEKPTEKVLTQENEESIRIKQQKEAKRKADNAVKEAKRKADIKLRRQKRKPKR